MLSLTSKTLYDDIADSGLKLVEDNQEGSQHEYVVELGYREGSRLNIEQVTITEDQRLDDSRALAEGSESALNAVIDLLDEDYELETEAGSRYVNF